MFSFSFSILILSISIGCLCLLIYVLFLLKQIILILQSRHIPKSLDEVDEVDAE